jgi:hypothetical protein
MEKQLLVDELINAVNDRTAQRLEKAGTETSSLTMERKQPALNSKLLSARR